MMEDRRVIQLEYLFIIFLLFIVVIETAVLIRRLEIAPTDVYNYVKVHDESSRRDSEAILREVMELRSDINVNRGLIEAARAVEASNK